MSGTIASQIIVVGGIFVLGRLYSTMSFGYISTFSSLATILAVITTGRYEYSVILPRSDRRGLLLAQLVMLIGLLVSVLYFFLIIFGESLFILKIKDLYETKLIYLIPLYVAVIVINTALNSYNQRQKRYNRISLSNLIQSVANMGISIGFGLLGYQWGMMAGLIMGMLVSSLYLLKFYPYFFRTFFRLNQYLKAAKRYIAFPKYMLLSDLSMVLGQQFTPIIFLSMFGASEVGLYGMAHRFIRLPSNVITSSLANVFRLEANEQFQKMGNCVPIFRAIFSKLLLIAFPLFFIIYFLAPWAFQTLVGRQWTASGDMAKLMTPMLFTEFLVMPFVSLFYILKKQKVYMFLQMGQTLSSIILLLWYNSQDKTIYECLVLLSIVFTSFNLFSLILIFRMVNGKKLI